MGELTIQQALNLAMQHHRAGRFGRAEQMYRQVLASQPEHPDALHGLGVLAAQRGRSDVAVDLIGRAVALHPNDAALHSDLGNALRGAGRLDEAIAAHRQAVALQPGWAQAYYSLGKALTDKGRLDEAIAAYRQAIVLKHDFPDAHANLGNALTVKGQLDEAIAAHRQAVALKPGTAEIHYNLGNALKDKEQWNEAVSAYRRAIALKSDFPEAHSNLGIVLKHQGQLDEAVVACRRAMTLKPDLAEAHCNLGTSLLLRGEFLQGWEEWEWRWRVKGLGLVGRDFSQPQWDGQSLEGRTLLLHAEQGLGDTMQFVRYVPLVQQRVGHGRIVLECPAELLRLCKPLANDGSTMLTARLSSPKSAGCQIVVQGQPLPAFDVHCPLLSLPRALATTLENLPHDVPYLHPDPGDVEAWRQRLAKEGDREEISDCQLPVANLVVSGESAIGNRQLQISSPSPVPCIKVGLVWGGNPAQREDRRRSMSLARLAPLARVPNVRFISLQKGPAGAQTQSPPAGLRLLDLTADLRDMADTAALIANLDLVISVCTSVAHLAGAMAKPVWTLLSCPADWRWLLERDDSPWYPTMRLFRQPTCGDWDTVVAAVTQALSAWAEPAKR